MALSIRLPWKMAKLHLIASHGGWKMMIRNGSGSLDIIIMFTSARKTSSSTVKWVGLPIAKSTLKIPNFVCTMWKPGCSGILVTMAGSTPDIDPKFSGGGASPRPGLGAVRRYPNPIPVVSYPWFHTRSTIPDALYIGLTPRPKPLGKH